MASKRDLVEAQQFSRRRLLTAFQSGAPGGQELEPASPMRGVVAGVALAVLLVVGSLAFGLLSPTLADGWDEASLVVVSDEGTRYVAVDGTLYPVLNTTSARLVLDSGAFDIVEVDAQDIADSPRGPALGIEGAPDAPPASDSLIVSGWRSCVADDGTVRTSIGLTTNAAGSTGTAVVVQSGDEHYLVDGGLRYRIPAPDLAAVQRALDLEQAEVVTVPAAWLMLLPAGTDLAPLVVEDAGEPVPSTSTLPGGASIGSLVAVTDATGVRSYVVDPSGDLAPLSDLAVLLYGLGSGAGAGDPLQVTAAQVASVPTADVAVAPADWPTEVPEPLPAGQVPCVDLVDGTAVSSGAAATEDAAVAVRPGAGALVRAASEAGSLGEVVLIDESGTAFPLPTADADVLGRLGYTADQVVDVPPAWVALLPTGPALTVEAASTPWTAQGGTDS
ncbi:type VII secretion protein EccB [Cellulomonas soli]|uniref:Type VII secretion protein EccB n=1 Tax=Cellulomonas soli TaxID=931535 RepID=A0A512P9H6_9CELL|nr:type VII secretion protein EccB [Cellulomonas soli]NYI57998.1 type VII secretion protein EccB [Cellulomonas soli]GEP67782.1 type VII secretion protein EccB [Cellulomonas soli]